MNPDVLHAYVEKVNRGLRERDVFQLYMEWKITSDRFGELDGPVTEKQKRLEAELPKVEAEISLLKIDGLTPRASGRGVDKPL